MAMSVGFNIGFLNNYLKVVITQKARAIAHDGCDKTDFFGMEQGFDYNWGHRCDVI